jgi:Raf kinase inhibitor-like YbhB/YbcL family protein
MKTQRWRDGRAGCAADGCNAPAYDWLPFVPVIFLAVTLTAYGGGSAMAFELQSPAFTNDGEIPRQYTCDGTDVSPPLAWQNPPSGTRSFTLIADDPDAPVGTWVHWVIYNLPAEMRGLPEGVPSSETLPDGSQQGINDFRKVGYGGPCPPRGPAHRYFFKLYALDSPTNLKPRATKQQLLDAMKGHILAEVQLMGRYRR